MRFGSLGVVNTFSTHVFSVYNWSIRAQPHCKSRSISNKEVEAEKFRNPIPFTTDLTIILLGMNLRKHV
jgi:hypothetical protein